MSFGSFERAASSPVSEINMVPLIDVMGSPCLLSRGARHLFGVFACDFAERCCSPQSDRGA